MKVLLTLLALGCGVAFAQPSPAYGWKQEKGAGFHAAGGASGQGLTNQFVRELFTSPLLQPSVIAAQSQQLSATNRLGADYELALHAKFALGKGKKTGLLLKVADATHADGRFNETTFSLAFLGNKNFAGDTAVAGPLRFNLMRWQQLGLGMWSNLGAAGQWWVMASYINGEQLASASITNLNIYTSKIGDTIMAGGTGRVWLSDTALKKFAANNGGGAAIDAGFNLRLGDAETGYDIAFSMHNLGMVQWHPRSMTIEFDTSIKFTGQYIADLENTDGYSATDSLDRLQRKVLSRGVINTALPAWFATSLEQFKPKGLEFSAQAVVAANADFEPYVAAGASWQFANGISLGAMAGYGGYAGGQCHFQAAIEQTKWCARFTVRHAEALLLPRSMVGLGGGITLSYLI